MKAEHVKRKLSAILSAEVVVGYSRLMGDKEFVRGIGLVDYRKEYGWPDFYHPVGDDFVCD